MQANGEKEISKLAASIRFLYTESGVVGFFKRLERGRGRDVLV